MRGIGIEQSPDHALVLGVMFTGFPLKVLDASLAQGDSHFDSFVPKDELFGSRQKIRNNSGADAWTPHQLLDDLAMSFHTTPRAWRREAAYGVARRAIGHTGFAD